MTDTTKGAALPAAAKPPSRGWELVAQVNEERAGWVQWNRPIPEWAACIFKERESA